MYDKCTSETDRYISNPLSSHNVGCNYTLCIYIIHGQGRVVLGVHRGHDSPKAPRDLTPQKNVKKERPRKQTATGSPMLFNMLLSLKRVSPCHKEHDMRASRHVSRVYRNGDIGILGQLLYPFYSGGKPFSSRIGKTLH